MKKYLKLRIYNKKDHAIEPVYLTLREYCGDITLVASNNQGEETKGHLLSITTTGRVRLFSNINKNLGFDLDETGTLRRA